MSEDSNDQDDDSVVEYVPAARVAHCLHIHGEVRFADMNLLCASLTSCTFMSKYDLRHLRAQSSQVGTHVNFQSIIESRRVHG
jgi:hypothetical protein